MIDSVDGMELLVWHRSSSFTSMILRKCTNQSSSQFVITDDLSVMKENIDLDSNTIYCGVDAESSVKLFLSSVKNKDSLLKTLTIFDKDVGYESLDSSSLSLRFNTMKSGVLGAHVSLPREEPSCQITGQVGRSQTKPKHESKIWTRKAILAEVERSVERVLHCGGDHTTIDHSASLMDVGIDSLAMADFTSSLRSHFNTEIPSIIVFNHPSIEDITDHLCELLGVKDPPAQMCFDQASRPSCSSEETISIVGISCRFPGGVSSPKEYWKLLCDGRETSSLVPFNRWDAFSLAANSNSLSKNERVQVLYGSFVNDMEYFDSCAFSISKREAEAMSPQQRILLECSYMSLLDARFMADKQMKGLNCGVFVGTSSESPRRPSNSGESVLSVYSFTGLAAPIASGRVSYTFNFQGPNMVYDTACSSSMVAFDSALSSLKEGKCDMALVVGVNSLFESVAFEQLARVGMLSQTGRCHSFDASADG